MPQAEILRAMAKAEEDLSKLIAKRALNCTSETERKNLRSLWRLSHVRAGYFQEMALNASD